jgi:hypothetical protein
VDPTLLRLGDDCSVSVRQLRGGLATIKVNDILEIADASFLGLTAQQAGLTRNIWMRLEGARGRGR